MDILFQLQQPVPRHQLQLRLPHKSTCRSSLSKASLTHGLEGRHCVLNQFNWLSLGNSSTPPSSSRSPVPPKQQSTRQTTSSGSGFHRDHSLHPSGSPFPRGILKHTSRLHSGMSSCIHLAKTQPENTYKNNNQPNRKPRGDKKRTGINKKHISGGKWKKK